MGRNEAIKLLDKYLRGVCSEEETQQVEAWLEGIYSGNKQWEILSEERKKAYIEQLFVDLKGKIDTKQASHKAKDGKIRYWAAAAVFFVIAASGLLSLFVFQRNQPSSNAGIHHYVKISSGVGQIRDLVLADGTKVWLNAMSELRYPESFSLGTREVYITGEAFFDVAEDAQNPFIVHSDKLNTKVLGTAFNVRAYPEDEGIEVTVVSGRVAVGDSASQERPVLLEKNEKASYSKTRLRIIKDKITNATDYQLWKQGKILFYHSPMQEVAKTLHRNFGIKIQFEDASLITKELSGQFYKSQDPESVLKAICLSIGGAYRINNGTVVLTALKEE